MNSARSTLSFSRPSPAVRSNARGSCWRTVSRPRGSHTFSHTRLGRLTLVLHHVASAHHVLGNEEQMAAITKTNSGRGVLATTTADGVRTVQRKFCMQCTAPGKLTDVNRRCRWCHFLSCESCMPQGQVLCNHCKTTRI